MTKWSTADISDQTGRVAIVTGANIGIGWHTAAELARAGATVILACRSAERAGAAVARLRAEVAGADVEAAPLDLADAGSIASFAAATLAARDRVDLLVNNAGVMAVPARRTTAQGFELQFGTNHLGHFALTGLLLPALLDTPGARVVTVSSTAHRTVRRIDMDDLQSERNYTPWGAYGLSKIANLLFAFELDRRLRARGAALASVAAHPGYASTNLIVAGPRLGRPSLTGRFGPAVTRVLGQSAAAGAWPSLYAATSPDVVGGDYAGPRGLGEQRGAPRKVGATALARDPETAARLWAASIALTNVTFSL